MPVPFVLQATVKVSLLIQSNIPHLPPQCNDFLYYRGCHSRDRMVVEFTTTCALSAYHH